MKYVFAILISFLMFACDEEIYKPKFHNGELVCHKAGGPLGVVYSQDTHSTGIVMVRIYYKPLDNTFRIGVGGGALIGGGDGIKEGGRYVLKMFEQYEILHELDCRDRK